MSDVVLGDMREGGVCSLVKDMKEDMFMKI